MIKISLEPVNCVWGEWSTYTACSKTCGNGTQARQRTIALEASQTGINCTGSDREAKECNDGRCAGRC